MNAAVCRLFVVLAGSLLVAACSSSDDIAGTTSPAVDSIATTEAQPTTETPVTEPTTVPVTTVPATTVPPMTVPPMTEPPMTEPPMTEPPTTEPPTAADTPEGEVVAAIAFFEEQWKECLRALPNCDTQSVIERRYREEVSTVQANAMRWNQNDYRADNIDALVYRVDDVAIAGDGMTAVATVCVSDGVALTEADGTVVDDDFYSSIERWDLVLIDGVWFSEFRANVGEPGVGVENDLCGEQE